MRATGISISNANITLRQLRAFLTVCGRAQLFPGRRAPHGVDAVDQRDIKELERQLKVTLFLRTTRSVELTDVGRVFSGCSPTSWTTSMTRYGWPRGWRPARAGR